jgi:hypothetical protein
MLGTKSANQLGMSGIILSNDLGPIFSVGGGHPFFAIHYRSSDPTEHELSLLQEYVPKHISTNYASGQIQDRFWGDDVTTIFLLKRSDAWFYCRGRRLTVWMPPNGLSLDELLVAI